TQESNFWYLCGVEEPNWLLVLDGTRGKSWLVSPELSDVHKTFDGSLSHEDAKRISGVDAVINSTELVELLRQLARVHPHVYTIGQTPHASHYNFVLNPAIDQNRQMLDLYFTQVQDCQKELAVLRAIKQPDELKQLHKAVAVTVAAFTMVHEKMSSYGNEFQIEADFAHSVRMSGATGCAYDSIVAAGSNACTLHYSKNSTKIRTRQLVLMDMGALYGGYAADVSRTYAKGEPTKRQREVHGAVEAAHHRIIRLVEPMLSVESYQSSVDKIMTEALTSIGLDSDEAGRLRYFPHAISHGLGIDVHDSLGGPKYFQENMVLTVEPGIYIPEEGIGVRIEDDILITSTGHKNLSASLSTGL
ncbi:aminopeptidase P N-terminal domain-containing protein, partial [Candidatus Saccharibacteria bacterium]|nr:aminopeptidase P N-terminal domain-containing protein [Candidatus Saccharibacteria bacterium]